MEAGKSKNASAASKIIHYLLKSCPDDDSLMR
jgi:hypothetical protein